MNSQTTIGDAIAVLEREIEERRRTVALLKSMLNGSSEHRKVTPAAPAASEQEPGEMTVGAAATAILKASGRPMHATRELLPLIQEKGIRVSKTTLPTALSRQKELFRTDPGVWAYKKNTEANGKT